MMGFRPKASSKFPPSLAPKRAKGNYHDVLEFPVGHGDMVVMHGAAIHRFYEVHMILCPRSPLFSRKFAINDSVANQDPSTVSYLTESGALP